jgi:hypothetical protein
MMQGGFLGACFHGWGIIVRFAVASLRSTEAKLAEILWMSRLHLPALNRKRLGHQVFDKHTAAFREPVADAS